jgi:hypothetical protein
MSFSVWSPVKPTILLYFVSLTPELVPSSAECKSDGFGDNSTLVDQEFICSIYSLQVRALLGAEKVQPLTELVCSSATFLN